MTEVVTGLLGLFSASVFLATHTMLIAVPFGNALTRAVQSILLERADVVAAVDRMHRANGRGQHRHSMNGSVA